MSSSLSSSERNLYIGVVASLGLHILALLIVPVLPPPPLAPSQQREPTRDLELTLVENPDNFEVPDRPRFLSRNESRAAGRLTEKAGLTTMSSPPSAVPVPAVPVPAAPVPAASAGEAVTPAAEIAGPLLRTAEGLRLAPDVVFDMERAFRMDLEGPPSLDTKRYEHADYFLRMAAKISRRWHDAIPLTAHAMGLIPTGEVRIIMLVGRDGRLLDYRVDRDFHYPSMTRAAVYAVTAAAPYEPFPAAIPDEALVIPVIFRYIGR